MTNLTLCKKTQHEYYFICIDPWYKMLSLQIYCVCINWIVWQNEHATTCDMFAIMGHPYILPMTNVLHSLPNIYLFLKNEVC
jgi:hypothetical protein